MATHELSKRKGIAEVAMTAADPEAAMRTVWRASMAMSAVDEEALARDILQAHQPGIQEAMSWVVLAKSDKSAFKGM